ncbi:MAG: sigma-54-dependent Fis family transcriptional regulator [Alphaproteobacteria bacterium CG_4_9_14_3_um_filter_47_13]|nr:MAG: sigma-54-dependent Fis family transcriptional regulator [Alphaproteobacteria bacterium CG_4_9_14_3_um_filter_47_13]
MAADILIIDDEADIRALIKGILEDEGYQARDAATDEKAYEQVKLKVPDLVILDIWLQGSQDDGLQILDRLKKDHPFLPVLMISGHGNIETAVSAIKQGAYDFIEKPFKFDRLLFMIERALETAKLRKENEKLRTKVLGASELIGESSCMITLRQTLIRVAQTNSRVLITGEQGTGKDLAARFIHRHSQRADKSFMVLNCAIMRPEWLEVELFGSENGVMGESGKIGVLEQADGGTLLLDEVADMPFETQGKIVRVLQEQRFQRVGGQEEVEANVRIIASSNRNLQKAMEQGDFRQDLFYRLNVVPIQIPSLRERVQDIQALADHFSALYSQQAGRSACRFDPAAIATMQAYDWPGNVRQLRNVVEWCMIMDPMVNDEQIKSYQLPPELTEVPLSESKRALKSTDLVSLPLREAREVFEKDYISAQIKRFGGNISKTAEFVEMERSALHRKMKQLGICAVTKQNDEPDDSGFLSIKAEQRERA